VSDTPERTSGGLAGRLAGKLKDVAGSLTGDDELAREGRLQQEAAAAAEARRRERAAETDRELQERIARAQER
jgi:uncharacterized protein YjbJ (UPF0337 family)